MRMYQASVPAEFGQWGIEVGTESLRRTEAKRVEQNERKRKTELMKEGVRRMFFQEGRGPDGVFNFGKYEGQTFAAVYLKDQSYAEWAVKQDKCWKWKLKCIKFFQKRLSDLEKGHEKRARAGREGNNDQGGVFGGRDGSGGNEGGGGAPCSMGRCG